MENTSEIYMFLEDLEVVRVILEAADEGFIEDIEDLNIYYEQLKDQSFRELLEDLFNENEESINELRTYLKSKIEKIEDESVLKEIATNPLVLGVGLQYVADENMQSKMLNISYESYEQTYEIWREVNANVKNANADLLPKIIDYAKGNARSIRAIWGNTTEEVQKANADLLPKIIDHTKGDAYSIRIIWENTTEEVQKANADLLPKIIDHTKGDAYSIRIIWEDTTEEVQKANADLLPKIIDHAKGDDYSIRNIWENTTEEVKKANADLLPKIIDYVKESVNSIEEIWGETPEEVKKANADLLPKIIDYVKESGHWWYIMVIWGESPEEVQKANADLLPEIIKEYADDEEEIGNIWKATTEEIQKEKFEEVINNVKKYRASLVSIWETTREDVQREKFEEVIKYAKDKEELIANIWKATTEEIQKEKFEKIMEQVSEQLQDISKGVAGIWEGTREDVQREKFEEVIKYAKDNEELIGNIWKATTEEIQKEKFEEIIEQVRGNYYSLAAIWDITNEEVQKEKIDNLFDIIGNIITEDGEKIRNSEGIKQLLDNVKKPNSIFLLWDKLTLEEQKDNFEIVCNKLISSSDTCQYLPEFLRKVDPNIDTEKLTEILFIKDNEYLSKHIMNDILIKNIGNHSIDVESVNSQISKIYNIFLTSNLPEMFKMYKFFEYHPNHNSNNSKLYSSEMSKTDRDKKIIGDLFNAALDSNNSQLKDFLELLNNGNIAYNKKKNGYELEEFEEAILHSYGNILIDLYGFYNDGILNKSLEPSENIEMIRKKLEADEKANIGDVLLSEFFKEIDLNIEDYGKGSKSISINLLKYMEQERKNSLERNCQEIDVQSLLEERRFNKKYRDTIFRFSLKIRNKIKRVLYGRKD